MVTAVLGFPGQGAQRVGMGKDVADRFAAAKEVFQAVDDALGVALSHLMWHGPEEELTLTHNAQPAILAHSLAIHAVVGPALEPIAAAGHSLGEYSAYAAAGALSVADASRLVRKRGELMLDAGRARAGTMQAVLGLETEAVQAACAAASVNGSVAVAANINTPDQTVISGDTDAVTRAAEGCKAAGAKRVLPLKVSGAFHSPLMAPAQEALEVELEQLGFAEPAFPIVANARAEIVRDRGRGLVLLREQLTAPVRWVECMQAAFGLAGDGVALVELGPGNVLGGLLKKIIPEVRRVSLEGADGVSAFLEQS